jgi:hypothetical protein
MKAKSVRVVFSEYNLVELLFKGKTRISGIKFVLGGKSGWNKVGVSEDDLKSITTGGMAISYGYFELKVEYILQDIGIYVIESYMKKYGYIQKRK